MTTLPNLSEGATGPDVRWAQYLLVRRTMSYDGVDGVFGPVTEGAVKGTQQFNHIDADGIVGMQTWAVPIHAAGQVIANLCGVPGPG